MCLKKMLLHKNRIELKTKDFVLALKELLESNGARLEHFDVNKRAFGNITVQIQYADKTHIFYSDRGEIYHNDKFICGNSYADNVDTFWQMLKTIEKQLFDN